MNLKDGWKMIQKTNSKPLHQLYSELDNEVFSAFCNSFKNVRWLADFKDGQDIFCGVDVQLSASTKNGKEKETFDVEIKSVSLNNLLPYCFFQSDKWLKLNEWDNNVKLYVAIYPKLNKVVTWRVNRELLQKSQKGFAEMKWNTCKGDNTRTKQVYYFRLNDGNVFDFDLTQFKPKYDALYLQTKKIKTS